MNMKPKTATKSLKLERTMKAPAERIYRAFLDRYAGSKFRAPHGYSAEFTTFEPRVGGRFAYTVRGVADPEGGTLSGVFTALVEFTRLAWREGFDPMPPGMEGEQEVTVTLAEKSGVTKVTFEVSGIPHMIPVDSAGRAYAQQLDLLTLLVESDLHHEG